MFDEDKAQEIQSTIDQALHKAFPEMTMVTGWVVVVEFSDGEGVQQLFRSWSPGTPHWKRDGMLHTALFSGWSTDYDEAEE